MRKELMAGLRKAGEGLGRADDAVQGAIRQHILRLPEDGSTLDGSRTSIPRQALGYFIHQARPNSPSATVYRDAPGAVGWMNTVASRAIQAGGLTAAGSALLDLTAAFGGPADQPEPRQLTLGQQEEEEKSGNSPYAVIKGGLIGAGATGLMLAGMDDTYLDANGRPIRRTY